MDFRVIGFNDPFFSSLQDMFDVSSSDHEVEKSVNTTSKKYVRDAKAMAATPADIKEYPDSEDEKEKEVKHVRMERRIGKFMRKFILPENANFDAISAICLDGVLTINVKKLPPPEPKKPKTIEVKVG